MQDRSEQRAKTSTRRGFLAGLLGGGLVVGSRRSEGAPVDIEHVRGAEDVAGLEFTGEERELLHSRLDERLADYRAIRGVPLPNSVPPAIRLGVREPAPSSQDETVRWSRVDAARPDAIEEIAFWPLAKLATLLRERRITSTELTELYLTRLERLDPQLHCVVTTTRDLALSEAARADAEIAAGRYRGPLHGIPWGAKDIIAKAGYRTTWGAKPFRDQVIDEDATVVRKLADAGAVLVAKLTTGALAMGDIWFDGRTRSPWNVERGSSGSSAGPGAATSAGLVGFAIGSETYGSIVSPSTVCGVTGLRPTFGAVGRGGVMALSWTMDKLGPMTRSVEDCAIVFAAIRGRDPADPASVDAPFSWDEGRPDRDLRVGYVASLFPDSPSTPRERSDRAVLDALREKGHRLVPVELPALPIRSLSFILEVEAAAAFDELTRSGRDDELVNQSRHAWPNIFRASRLVPAVEYVQAQRVRHLLQRAMEEVFRTVDVYVAPSFSESLLLTNLTGHPAVVVPNGFDGGMPTSVTFTADLYRERDALVVAKEFQDATDWHTRHPPIG